jgi:hypothetical protein
MKGRETFDKPKLDDRVIKILPKEIECKDVNWFQEAYNKNQRCVLVNTVMNPWVP